MVTVRNCRDFDRLWNDQLDDRAGGLGVPARAEALAEHAAGCERCLSRDLIFQDVEALLGPAAPAPLATPEAIARWVAAASEARPAAATWPPLTAAPAAPRPRRWHGRACRSSAVAGATAAAFLVGAKLVLPVLYPIEPPPTWADREPAASLEEAFTELMSITKELAQEIPWPAARIGFEELGRGDVSPPSPSRPSQFELAEVAARPATGPAEAGDPAGVELIAGSAQHAFEFLMGTASDEAAELDTAGGS